MKRIYWIIILLLNFQLYAKQEYTLQNQSTFLPPPDVANDTLFFDLRNAVYSFTNTTKWIDIPIFIKSKGPVSSFDFRLKFNQSKLTYVSTINVEKQLQPFTSLNPNDNFLRNNTSGPGVSYVIPNNTTLVYVRFQSNEKCSTITENDFYSITTLLVGYPCKNQVTPVTPITSNTLLTHSLLTVGKPILFEGPSNAFGIPITNYLWNLGNGTKSTDQNITTTYVQEGNYIATLEITSAEGCKDTITQNIELKSVGLDATIDFQSIKIHPNPANGLIHLLVGVNSKVTITNIASQTIIYSDEITANTEQTINVSTFSNGVYLIQVTNKQFEKTEKITINNL